VAEGLLVGGRYRLETRLGSGGMADVWRARDEFLGRVVAVKEVRLPAGLTAAQRAEADERVLREARAAAALPHPSIITVHDVLQQDGRPWIVMDLITGPSLEELRRRGPLPPRRVAEIGLQLLDALSLAHARGVLHRDVKPANVMLSGDQAVLTDFGIATIEGDRRMTSAHGIIGSPGWMAPERLHDGHPVGPESDLWSLGATMYALAEGRRPFERPDALALLGAVLMDNPPPPERSGPLGPVLMAMMHREPAHRPAPAVVRRALLAVLTGTGAMTTAASPVVLRHRTSSPDRLPTGPASSGRNRRSGPILLAAVATLVAVLGVGFLLIRPGDAPAAPAARSASPFGIASAAARTGPPEPCSLLTDAQAGEFTAGTSRVSRRDSTSCTWGGLTITVRYSVDQAGKTGEAQAKDTFALLRRQAANAAGTGGDPAISVDNSDVRAVPDLGAEAFAQDRVSNDLTATGGLLDSTKSTLWTRSGPLVLEIESSGSSSVAKLSAQARKAAGYALEDAAS
jgi:hypothetical protein